MEDLASSDHDLQGKIYFTNYLHRNHIMLSDDDYVKSMTLLIDQVMPQVRNPNPSQIELR